jgi:hypothetical protein
MLTRHASVPSNFSDGCSQLDLYKRNVLQMASGEQLADIIASGGIKLPVIETQTSL